MPEQKWTPKMVAERLEEAARTLRVLRITGLKPSGYGSTWPDVVHDPNEAFGWNATEVRVGPPTPESITRMDEALNWLRWLEPDQMRLVWLHAEGVNRKTIMTRVGLSRTKAWRMWMAALMTMASMLNLNKKTHIPDVTIDQPTNDHTNAFQLEYYRTGNATEAYRKSHDAAGLSDVALRSRAFRLAKKVGVAQQCLKNAT